LVGSERFIEYRPRIDYGWRSYQMAFIIDVVQAAPTKQEESEACLKGRLKAKNQYGRLYAPTWIVLTLSDRGYLARCGRCVVGFDKCKMQLEDRRRATRIPAWKIGSAAYGVNWADVQPDGAASCNQD
jgi:hypothetical protein